MIRGPDRTILSWNAAAERLFGWSAQEAVGLLYVAFAAGAPASEPGRDRLVLASEAAKDKAAGMTEEG